MRSIASSCIAQTGCVRSSGGYVALECSGGVRIAYLNTDPFRHITIHRSAQCESEGRLSVEIPADY